MKEDRSNNIHNDLVGSDIQAGNGSVYGGRDMKMMAHSNKEGCREV